MTEFNIPTPDQVRHEREETIQEAIAAAAEKFRELVGNQDEGPYRLDFASLRSGRTPRCQTAIIDMFIQRGWKVARINTLMISIAAP